MTTPIPGIQTANINGFQSALKKFLDLLDRDDVISRIWKRDWTVWKKDDREISDRLGWLASPQESEKRLPEYERIVDDLRRDGFTHALLLGMGGSSLGPEVFSRVFNKKAGFLDLSVLDSTDPAALLNHKNRLDPEKTAYLVSSKSGTTIETLSFFKYFYLRVSEGIGRNQAGRHFIAITDPGTSLMKTAKELRFRAILSGSPEIGGRYSILSPFGLFPAALKGIEIHRLLAWAAETGRSCLISPSRNNPAAFLGALLAALRSAGRDKAYLVLSPRLEPFGFWLEQLIAESLGKEGRGILPLVRKTPFLKTDFSADSLCIHFCLQEDAEAEEAWRGLFQSSIPVVSIPLPDVLSLGGQFFLWEMAVAVAGSLLGVNPFDQPDVDSAKQKTRAFLDDPDQKKKLLAVQNEIQEKDPPLFIAGKKESLKPGLLDLLSQAAKGDYVAVLAFLQPSPENALSLEKLRDKMETKFEVPVAVGFGPRYLHSTGQLHKGDAGQGIFIFLLDSNAEDVSIPDLPTTPQSTISFGLLKAAQAWGDFETLKFKGRRAGLCLWKGDAPTVLGKLLELI